MKFWSLAIIIAVMCWSTPSLAESEVQNVTFKKLDESLGYAKIAWKAQIFTTEKGTYWLKIQMLDGTGFEQHMIFQSFHGSENSYMEATGSTLVKTDTWKKIKDYKAELICP